jgi:hypothetical protein
VAILALPLGLLLAWNMDAHGEETDAAAPASVSSGTDHYAREIKPLLQTYCYECHGNGASEGKRAFDELEASGKLLNDPHVWTAMLNNVRAGVMPPEGSDRPSHEDVRKITEWVKRDVFKIDPAHPDPGSVVLRRMNRLEYRNTIRDLLGHDYDVELNFPPDDTGYGFDTIGDVLTVSPMLTEKYLAAAESIVDAVVPKVSRQPAETKFSGGDFVGTTTNANEESGEGETPGRGGRVTGQSVNFDVAAELNATFKAAMDGQYNIDMELRVNGQFEYNPLRTHVRFFVDGEEHIDEIFVYESGISHFYKIPANFKQGDHNLKFVFEPLPPAEDAPEGRIDRMVRLIVRGATVSGPTAREHWVKPRNFDRIFSREFPPEAESEREEYARELLGKFAKRAFRRPVDAATVDALTQIAAGEWRKDGKTFEQGVGRAMVAVLASPRFLYRVEQSLPKAEGDKYPLIDEYALASRLSYFLWSTMPDEELFRLADEGRLREQLDAQLDRMLAHERNQAFVENFAGQWLRARDVAHIRIDAAAVARADLSPEEAAAQMPPGGGRGRGRGNRRGNPPGVNMPPADAAVADPIAVAAAAEAAANAAPANDAAAEQSPPVAADGRSDRLLTEAAAIAPEDAQRILAEQATPAVATPPAETPRAAAAASADPAAPANLEPRGRRGRGERGQRGQRGQLANRGQGRGGRGRGEFDAQLRRSMQQETEMQFAYIMRENRSLLELLDADYTFLNERLAEHYNITGVTGAEMRLVKLEPDSPRGGVLTQGTLLTITSNPDRTSPVKRGFFILENILGTPPPPPPADIPDLDAAADKLTGKNPTLREVLELHRDSPMCKACHARMDPLGLALENFNAMGVWRTSEKGLPINATGRLVSGEEFNNIKVLKTILKDTKKRDFYQCVTEKLMTYALGRGVEYTDSHNVEMIVDELERENGKFSVLLKGIIKSPQFQRRREIGEKAIVAADSQSQKEGGPASSDKLP